MQAQWISRQTKRGTQLHHGLVMIAGGVDHKFRDIEPLAVAVVVGVLDREDFVVGGRADQVRENAVVHVIFEGRREKSVGEQRGRRD